MKVIFMGTPEFSVGTLEALIQAGHEVVLAVTQPDKPKGRGGNMQYPPVKETALAHGIPVFQPKKIRDAENIEELRKYPADVMVVIAFGQILPQEILDMTPYGCINVHASLLPKYRGAAPIQWAVMNGEQVSGVTTMQMDAGLDTGDMLLKTEVVLDPKETGGSLHDKLAQAGARLCVETLKGLEAHTITPQKQGESPTEIRGLNPWPSAYTGWEGKVMKIWEAEVIPQETEPAAPGTVVRVEKDGFLVQTGNGLLKVTALQIPGKKRMDAGAFLRGYSVKEGMVLGGE